MGLPSTLRLQGFDKLRSLLLLETEQRASREEGATEIGRLQAGRRRIARCTAAPERQMATASIAAALCPYESVQAVTGRKTSFGSPGQITCPLVISALGVRATVSEDWTLCFTGILNAQLRACANQTALRKPLEHSPPAVAACAAGHRALLPAFSCCAAALLGCAGGLRCGDLRNAFLVAGITAAIATAPVQIRQQL